MTDVLEDDAFWASLEASTATAEVEDLVTHLQPLTIGMALTTPIVNEGDFVYRARRLGNGGLPRDAPIRMVDLVYPPRECTPLGRANRAGDPVFYCSLGKEALFYEMGELRSGEELLVTFWQSTARMVLNNIGYTQFVFDTLGAKRPCPLWSPTSNEKAATMSVPSVDEAHITKVIASDRNRKLRERLSKYFMLKVAENESHKYKLTAAIARCHLGHIANAPEQFAGIVYPSVRMWANADNIALLPWFVDSHLRFRKAVRVRIEKSTGSDVSITNLDVAREFAGDGSLRWLGRLPNWTIPGGAMATVTLKAGRDSDGDYSRDKNGEVCHWAVVDARTGLVIGAR